MKLFKILEKESNKKKIRKSDDYKFFNENKFELNKNPYFEKYGEVSNIFDVICSNIVICGLQNKEKLDKIIEEEYFASGERKIENIKNEINERIIDLPYLKVQNIKVYIPFFNINTNAIYSLRSEQMSNEPYVNLAENYSAFLTDPFTTYGVDIFDFLSTKLVRIDECATAVAFYHFDFNAIFIINRQGSLDNVIYLFDRNIKHPNFNHIVDRIRPVIKAYFDGNLNDFIYLLYKNSLISYNTFRKICKEKKLWHF